MTDEVMELADIPAEYEYVKNLRCKRCGGRVDAARAGSEPGEPGNPLGRMHDIWNITCSSCGDTRQLVFSVPNTLATMLGTLGSEP